MKFTKNEVFTLWIRNTPTSLNYYCWSSWIKLGYSVRLYYDDARILADIPLKLRQKLSLISLDTLPPSFAFIKENLLHYTDTWRFMMLNTFGGTWLDSDMFLLKRLPDDNIIISSERTLQAGGRKSKETFRPNIGVLRFPPYHPFTKAVVDKMMPDTKEDSNDSSNNTSKMLKFIKMLKTKKWSHLNEFVKPPEFFCNVDYPFAKELYTHDMAKPIKKKYGLDFNTDMTQPYAIHLWENMALNKFKIDVNNPKPNTLYKKLVVIVE